MSTRKFSVGDRVRIINGPRSGVVTQIIGDPVWCAASPSGKRPAGLGYPVDLPCSTHPENNAWYPPEALKLFYDGNQAASWSDCAWQPRTLKV